MELISFHLFIYLFIHLFVLLKVEMMNLLLNFLEFGLRHRICILIMLQQTNYIRSKYLKNFLSNIFIIAIIIILAIWNYETRIMHKAVK